MLLSSLPAIYLLFFHPLLLGIALTGKGDRKHDYLRKIAQDTVEDFNGYITLVTPCISVRILTICISCVYD